MDTFLEYQYGYANAIATAATIVVSPFVAAMMVASLLKSQNQDLWGNIRLPSIERLTDDENTSLVNISDPTNIEYPSLVGVPHTVLPSTGNTTFTLSGSYLNVTCGVFELQSSFTNFTGSNAPNPGSNTDCTWTVSPSNQTGGIGSLQIAISQPCNVVQINNGSRDARKLIWESSDQIMGDELTHAECELYTTYVDVNMLCVRSTCSPSSVQRTPQPPRNRNWTVFDFRGGALDSSGFLILFNAMFPDASVSGGQYPQIKYFVDPYNAILSSNTTNVYAVGKSVFEIRLAQMLNAQLVLGISPSEVAGNFNPSQASVPGVQRIKTSATTSVEQDIVHCDRVWVGMLVATSLIVFVVAFIAAILRLITLVLDVLGTLSLAMLDNECQTLTGNSVWSGSERAVKMRGVKMRLGDVHPDSEVRRIALAAPLESTAVSVVQRGRLYK
jgi:hypothetical protein